MPRDERLRRREELTSHIWEWSEVHGNSTRSRVRLVATAARGSVDDLSWCQSVRADRGMSTLGEAAVLEPLGATVVAGVAITTGAALSLSDSATMVALKNISLATAGGVTTASLGLRSWRWFRSRQ